MKSKRSIEPRRSGLLPRLYPKLAQPATITRLELGQTYITPGAEEALLITGQAGIEFLRRHMSNDWGELSDEDEREKRAFTKGRLPFVERVSRRERKEALDHRRGRSQLNNNSPA